MVMVVVAEIIRRAMETKGRWELQHTHVHDHQDMGFNMLWGSDAQVCAIMPEVVLNMAKSMICHMI